MTSSSSSVTYSSTRGGQSHLDFRTVVMQGLAHDRGLFVPDEIPTVSITELQDWRSLSYPDLAVQVLRKFIQDDQVPLHKLQHIVRKSCAAFRHPDVTPVVHVGGHAILVRVVACTCCFRVVAPKTGPRVPDGVFDSLFSVVRSQQNILLPQPLWFLLALLLGIVPWPDLCL